MLYSAFPRLPRLVAPAILTFLFIVAGRIVSAQTQDTFPVILDEDNFLNTRYTHQAWNDPNRPSFIRELEASRWIKSDTVVLFNPETYEGTTQVYSLDYSPERDVSGEWVYKMVDEMPGFPGGEEAMVEYISNHVRSPKGRAVGPVYVRIVVDQAGALRQVEALGTAADVYKNEAIRVIRQMPVWTPGVKEGKKVNCEIVVPVQF